MTTPADIALPAYTAHITRVPPFPRLKTRIEWAYRHRGEEPSSAFCPSVASERTLCLLCNVELAENYKTRSRHMGTLQHLIHVSEQLQVDLDTLRLTLFRCDDCGKEFKSSRRDVLKRHQTRFCKPSTPHPDAGTSEIPQTDSSQWSLQVTSGEPNKGASSSNPTGNRIPHGFGWTDCETSSQNLSDGEDVTTPQQTNRESQYSTLTGVPASTDLVDLFVPTCAALSTSPMPWHENESLLDANADWFDEWIEFKSS